MRKDDIVLHLRGKDRRAAFVGYSTADSNGYQTSSRPPLAGEWAYASTFYRVPLTGFVPFTDPIPLAQVFASHDDALREYFEANSHRPTRQRERLFFVIQSRRLQCLNGAYLSELSEPLATIILGPSFGARSSSRSGAPPSNAVTGEQLAR